ncbi:receptor-interacting serine/threonine-protein kinase 3-like isoform X2 [Anoplopoma fimbria]|uniref:receptor-interacting serine/threonine-protein kinase 3-like isoform X2 n=1 Tax=Anoplopoma fimbria TaxID=229290 RepID=UPI0023EC9AA4|nr:receptor-interacting serine/threonine-protein kinase 3-like isoform X2 [Anoplopoma fimbria]
MELLSHKTEPVGNESLEKWEPVGSGGFGRVYKARHKDLGIDVAIKILHDGVCPTMSLWDEASHMDKAPCEYVVRLYGTYQGCPPVGGTSTQQGLVMDFMGRGSVQSLQKELSGPPPWPLVCRWAHQVAVGMSFLHSRNLVHHDLKPSNVLLNAELNAKLADFGLSRVSTSALNSNRETMGIIGGSYRYMPPEAFNASYEPVRSFDVYSYGILLWSIITGKEPYPCASYDLVELKIPFGDRPSCEEIDQRREQGLKELVDLMKRCWDHSPTKRPTFKNCREDTENVFSKHEKGILNVVAQVVTQLESPASIQANRSAAFNVPLQTPEQSKSNDTVENALRSSAQDSVRISNRRMSRADKAKFVDDYRAKLIQNVTEVMAITDALGNMVHREAYSVIDAKATSQDKMRVMYQRTLHSGGEEAKAAFYDTLKDHQPDLVKRLGGLI